MDAKKEDQDLEGAGSHFASAGTLRVLPVGALGTNCYLLYDGRGGVVVVDPGDDAQAIEAALDGRPVSLVLVTHGHFDHVGALDEVAALSVGGWVIGAPDGEGLDASLDASAVDFGRRVRVSSKPSRLLRDGDEVSVGDLKFKVLACPGHTPGGVSYYDPEHDLVFTGDTLFAGSAGRTDLLGGDERALFGSLARLAQLPPETKVLPGHGPGSTVAREVRMNPYVRHALSLF